MDCTMSFVAWRQYNMELKSLKISLKSTKVHIKQHFQIYIKTRAKVAQNFGFIIISVLIIIILLQPEHTQAA